ncbi:pseudouridine-5'-phosphatase isoform X1 [Tribolium madens]|uniref:pseudouridine-5'-phosphatase isoform X1 n=1 Tax=Tribolium madens TaxID=41895 RepID=UPI001CF72813|nr:pseudouridine-5'-phosphatase isoform X1 [Tribolium madens]
MNKVSCSAKVAFKKVTHVIFDLDGLLLDTESIYKRVFSDIAKKYGKVYTPEIQAKVIGRVEREGAKVAVTEMKLPISPSQFLQQYKSMAENSLASVGIMPGAERLVRHFHSKQVPIAVATSSGQDTYDLKVAKHTSLFSLFSHVVTGGTDPEVERGKPSPDIFLVCASRFKDKPKPEQCLVFEDAPNGVQAALGAGMQVVWVPDKQTDESLGKMATLKLNSLEEMKPELFGLPPLEK